MVHYKLTYFNGRGLAEIIRQLFAVARQDYEDVHLTFEEWPEHKDKMPFGQMPVLEFDGKTLCQSHAIARYLARKFGYAGISEFDKAVVDSIMDQSKDFLTEIRPYFRALLGVEKGDPEELVKEVMLPARDRFFPLITKFLKNNKSGFLVGDSLTWADLYVAELAELATVAPTLYDGYPELKSHSEKVRSNPQLKKWLETRPQTKF